MRFIKLTIEYRYEEDKGTAVMVSADDIVCFYSQRNNSYYVERDDSVTWTRIELSNTDSLCVQESVAQITEMILALDPAKEQV